MRTRLRSASLRLALAAAPMLLVDAGLAVTVRTIARRHRGLVARLAPSAGARVLIEIADLPCALLLTIEEAPRLPSLRLATGADRKLATASVVGKLSQLIELLDGDVDGDTMFFSRDLSITGDTSAILLLRNALDSEDIDLFDDMLDLLGPFARPVRGIRQRVAAAARNVARRTAARRVRRLAAPAGSDTEA
jgi:O2-independent ubiquinone biosynthesis accessory factor UbiT